jgi:hypothetical protein
MDSISITVPGPLGVPDEQGNPTPGTPVTTTSDDWFVAGNNGGAEEATDYGTADVPRITIYNRSEVTIPADAQITIRGRVWKVAGVVEPWRSPWGTDLGGTAVTLERAG